MKGLEKGAPPLSRDGLRPLDRKPGIHHAIAEFELLIPIRRRSKFLASAPVIAQTVVSGAFLLVGFPVAAVTGTTDELVEICWTQPVDRTFRRPLGEL